MQLKDLQEMLKITKINKVAEATGLSRFTIANIRDGITEPKLSTYQLLVDFFEGKIKGE